MALNPVPHLVLPCSKARGVNSKPSHPERKSTQSRGAFEMRYLVGTKKTQSKGLTLTNRKKG